MSENNPEVLPEASSFELALRAGALQRNYEQRIEGTRTRGRDGISALHLKPEQLDRLVAIAESRILDGTYVFSPYKEVLRLKGAAKFPRVISIPTLRDRLILATLAEHLRESIPSIEFPRPQQLVSNIRGAVKSGLYRDFIRLDIMSFYPSISHQAISKALERYGISADVVQLTLDAAQTPTLPDGHVTAVPARPTKGVPAGTVIANVLGEIVLHSFDEAVSALPGIAYFRYVDDILILSPYGKRGSITELVHSELRMVGLKAHPKESKDKSSTGILRKQPFEYLGYTFERGKVTVHKSRHSRLINNLARPITMLRRAAQESRADIERIRIRAEWWLNFRITGCISEETRRGWLPYYSQIDNTSLLHHLDDVVAKLISRLPSETKINPKSFLTAYTFTRDPTRDRVQYIPNFDLITDPVDMKNLLEAASDYRSIPSDPAGIERLFRQFISFAIKELEMDVGGTS
ncbi:RNA-directed DNA polymerase [Cryobacterium tagatosivorans]|uniref:RNA-directed DNA polymerase n=1 Tax=Cryobacterium tagatosivorans TaxID=1259199 RepID=UPI00141B89DB|nr:RNA-directed DNA polymerase [Cryobacterium tagatosivorans]